MKRTMKKMLSFGLVAAMSLTMLAGCGNSKDATNDTNVSNGQEEKKPTGDVKIGVLVQDVSGEEALGFRSSVFASAVRRQKLSAFSPISDHRNCFSPVHHRAASGIIVNTAPQHLLLAFHTELSGRRTGRQNDGGCLIGPGRLC